MQRVATIGNKQSCLCMERSSSHLGMLTSIMFGQIDDAHLHMTGCAGLSWTGLDGGQSSYGNMQAERKWASRQAGSDAYFHGRWQEHTNVDEGDGEYMLGLAGCAILLHPPKHGRPFS